VDRLDRSGSRVKLKCSKMLLFCKTHHIPTSMIHRIPIPFLILVFLVPASFGQDKRVLEHEDVYDWIRMSDVELSRDGEWVAWTEAPDRGDGHVTISSADGDEKFTVPRGQDPVFSGSSRYVLFRIVPQADSVRQHKLDDVPKKDLPTDSLGILSLENGSIRTYANVQSFGVSDEEGALAWWKLTKEASKDLLKPDSTEVQAEEEEEEEEETSEEADEDTPDKKNGVAMMVAHLSTDVVKTLHHVTQAWVHPKGESILFFRENDKGDVDGVYAVEGNDLAERTVDTGTGNYVQLALTDSGDQLAFLTNREDFEADQPSFSLYVGSMDGVDLAASEGDAGIPDGWWISENGTISFSESGNRVFFGTAPRPDPDPEDEDILDEEKVKVDIWNWKDPLLQPMQLVRLNQERNRHYRAVLHQDSDTIVQMGSEDIPSVRMDPDGDGAFAVGVTNMPYQQDVSWDWPVRQDTWLIDVATGDHRLVLEAVRDTPRLSPQGGYITWWAREIGHWMMMDVATGEMHNVTSGVDASFVNALDDRAYDPSSYGTGGWTEEDGEFLIYGKYDVWAASPNGSIRNLTQGAGRAAGVELRIQDLNPEEVAHVTDEDWLLRALHLDTMEGGFWEVDPEDGDAEPVIMSAHSYRIRAKAADADAILFSKESYTKASDLFTSDVEFDDPVRLSWLNPQQADFNWGTNKLVNWTSIDGDPLKGILYMPEGFDASEEYPMMVYFYEKYSRNLHRHYAPSTGGSSINFTFYTSRGYLVFIPDIPYKTGYPGESAMNAIMPGVTALIDQGIVDRDRIGVQGHSWGGYQIAYMVTQTDLFAAAEAGAPVSNMTSAYGGIRWASGMSRMFQYEKTQSRIGGTLWNAQQRYIHNSPLFQADKVKTPVLMMHNDEDGAVPWYQGIEFFVALRRLGQPVWMLNYNGAGHGLSDLDDRRDWQRRMQQFYDHYLMDAPAPVWLEEGVPAIRKGKTMGFEPAGTN
jgi:dipeptidyl aminopeptidase/acylaminoacyl peptidase